MSQHKNRRSRQYAAKTAAELNTVLLLTILRYSSRIRNMDVLIARLQFHSIPHLFVFSSNTPPLPHTPYEIDIGAIIKAGIKREFHKAEKNEALALENMEKRAEYERKLDEVLSGPIPEDEYRAVCKEYPISQKKYVAAERAAALYLLPTDRFTVHAVIRAHPHTIEVDVPEQEVLGLMDDIRRELAAQSQPQKRKEM